jgi:hypothetical protein
VPLMLAIRQTVNVGSGSRREELNVSKSFPLYPHKAEVGADLKHFRVGPKHPEPTLTVCRIASIKGTTLGTRHRCCITLP